MFFCNLKEHETEQSNECTQYMWNVLMEMNASINIIINFNWNLFWKLFTVEQNGSKDDGLSLHADWMVTDFSVPQCSHWG